MSRGRLLLAIAVAGIIILGLSLVQGWIFHEREVRGEGYRFVEHTVSAWSGAGVPVLTLGVLAAALVSAGAVASLIGRFRVPPTVLLVGSSLVVGLLAAGAWPVSQSGHASDVMLSAGLLLIPGIGLALVMAAASWALVRPSGMVLGAAVVIGLVAVVGGAGGRWLVLQLAEGTGRHWSEGSYTRVATAGEPTETMTIEGDTVTIGDRWSGSWEWSGWTVVIDDDPACPDSRGTYHAHGEGEEDLRFVKLVDTCQDGARAADLETGIWARDG